MKLQTVGPFCRCRLPEQVDKALVYVDYVEVAPWNLKTLAAALGEKPVYNAVGSRLVEAAVLKSKEEDCKGRVGLHSLPITELFYRKVCGMTPVGRDSAKQNLLWLEYTPGPVSYTHLDVYKRQAFTRWLRNASTEGRNFFLKMTKRKRRS